MKKVYFSKMAFAALAVAGLALTSCEKEDFKVNIPNVEIPQVEFPKGQVFLNLSSTSTDGTQLVNAKYYNAASGEEFNATVPFTSAETLGLMSVAGGYEPATKDVTVPAITTGTLMFPVNFVLTSLDESSSNVDVAMQPSVSQNPGVADTELPKSQTFNGNFGIGTHTIEVETPQATPYLTSAQRDQLLSKVDALTATRAASDLVQAKGLLRAQILGFATSPSYEKKELPIIVKNAPITSVTIKWKVEVKTGAIVFSTLVNDKEYSVSGEYTQAGVSEPVVADFTAADHGHGHGHGADVNAGGGTSGSK